MSSDLEKTPSTTNGHPGENQLLLALERELSPEEALQIDKHLGGCWSCRARYHDLQRGILAFVEYREKRYLPALDRPPHDFGDFPRRLRAIAAETRSPRLLTEVWRRIWMRLTSPGQFAWVTATAVIMVLVIVWTQVLNPPSVSASELLTRAAAFQNPPRQGVSSLPRKVHQKVRVSDGQRTIVRDFDWNIGSPIPNAHWELQSASTSWNAPLTAEGFTAWRDSVSEKQDRVKRSGDQWTLETTAVNDPVKEAWLVVRVNDFHPIEQHIRFADDRRLDFEELTFEISYQHPEGLQQSRTQIAQKSAVKVPEAAPEPAVNLNETEFLVRYTMAQNQWDLDEDLLITKAPRQVVVSGTASSPDRALSMHMVLGSLPNVRVSIAAPAPGQQTATSRPTLAKSIASPSMPLLRDTLDRTFPAPEDRRAFVDRCLSASDTMVSHAWALRKLVDRYSDQEEALLPRESRTELHEILRTHLERLGAARTDLDPLVELLPTSSMREPDEPGSWRESILTLFTQVQQEDSLVAALVAGTRKDGQDAADASQRLRSANRAIQVLLNNSLEGLSTVK